MRVEDPDEAVLRRIAEGDSSAVQALVEGKLNRIFALASRILGDATEAEDVAQDALLRAWRQAPRWRPDGRARFDTWLHRVVLNLCYDRLRRRREQPRAEPPDSADPALPADRRLEDAETARSVRAAVSALPTRQREAILLVHYQDLSNIQAAKVLGVSVEALESLLTRGRRTLREALKGLSS